MFANLGAAAREEEGLNGDSGCGAFPGSRGIGLVWVAPPPGEDSSTPPRASETPVRFRSGSNPGEETGEDADDTRCRRLRAPPGSPRREATRGRARPADRDRTPSAALPWAHLRRPAGWGRGGGDAAAQAAQAGGAQAPPLPPGPEVPEPSPRSSRPGRPRGRAT